MFVILHICTLGKCLSVSMKQVTFEQVIVTQRQFECQVLCTDLALFAVSEEFVAWLLF